MASPSVTNTFSNGTAIDAAQVNTNFTDLINAVIDGTKDLSINALTCAGTATLNGHVNLGNSTADDLTITASLAASLAVKTNTTYDVGSSTLGLRAIYFGGTSSFTTKIAAAATSTWTFTLPVAAGTDGYEMQTNGSGTTSWFPSLSIDSVKNAGIACSVATNAMTIALKGADGNDPSSTNPVRVSFRNATSATGTPVFRSVTGALSLTLPSSSTLGTASAGTNYIYVYAIDNAGTVELAASLSLFSEYSVQSSTTISSSATSNATLYSATGRSNVAVRLIARLKSTQTTAGTWAAVPTEISLCDWAETAGDIVYARYTVTSATSITTGGSAIIVNFDTKDLDSHNAVTTGASWKFTAPRDGIYDVAASVAMTNASWGAGNDWGLNVYKGGVVHSRLFYWVAQATNANNEPGGAGSTIIKLVAGDTVDIRCTSTGATANTLTGVSAFVSIKRIGNIGN